MSTAEKLAEPLMTPEEVAAFLKVSLSTVYTLARTHRLPGVRIGVQWRFDPETVRAFGRGDLPPPSAPTPISSGRRRRV
jgi:excisionase family DNA binding protein